ncbi:hypothetical protein [uncultured Roseobacter sp.]|uniref:hypothetical protein n=1 Tax=uncultured Roseobacter sp. TaxID=114847 RepID=UPI002608D36B|nr:hypothetical protein [uncultured Roseobacter sp.]
MTKSIDACAIVGACTAAFFLTPPSYSASIPHIKTYTATHYAIAETSTLAVAVSVAWGVLLLAIIFVLTRFLSSAIALALTSRFFARWL